MAFWKTDLKDNPTPEMQQIPVNLPTDLLRSLCFNCDNRSHCIFVESRKIYCELFE